MTLVAAGITLGLSPTRLRTARTTSCNRKRDFRPVRSHDLVATLLDEGYALHRFASLWGGAIRSLHYKLPYCEISRTIRFSVDAKAVSVPRSVVASSPTLHELPVTSDSPRTVPSPRSSHFCLPRIVITPPSDEGPPSARPNEVPTPQDAAHGNLLTVPDPDLHVINRSGRARTLFDSPYLRRERLYSYPGACKKPRIPLFPARKPSVVTCVIQKPVPAEEDEDEIIDLGPTWCG